MQIREILSERNQGGTRLSMTVRGGPRQTLKIKADTARANFTNMLKNINSSKATEFLNAFVKHQVKQVKQRAKIYTPGSGFDRKRAADLFSVLRKSHLTKIEKYKRIRLALAHVNTAMGQNIYSVYGAYVMPLVNVALTGIVIGDLIQQHKQDPKAMNIALIAWYAVLVPVEMLAPLIAMGVMTVEMAAFAKDLINEATSGNEDSETMSSLISALENEISKVSAEGVLAAEKELDKLDSAAENLHYNPDLNNAKQEIARMYPKLPEEHVEPLANDLLDAVDNDVDNLLNATKAAREAMQL